MNKKLILFFGIILAVVAYFYGQVLKASSYLPLDRFSEVLYEREIISRDSFENEVNGQYISLETLTNGIGLSLQSFEKEGAFKAQLFLRQIVCFRFGLMSNAKLMKSIESQYGVRTVSSDVLATLLDINLKNLKKHSRNMKIKRTIGGLLPIIVVALFLPFLIVPSNTKLSRCHIKRRVL